MKQLYTLYRDRVEQGVNGGMDGIFSQDWHVKELEHYFSAKLLAQTNAISVMEIILWGYFHRKVIFVPLK